MPTLSATVSTLHLLADETRLRLLSVLRDRELTVQQLTQVLSLAQSRVSTHLGKLREAGLVRDRRSGSSSFYRAAEPLPASVAKMLPELLADVDDAILASDRERAAAVLESANAGVFPDSVAGAMERYYSPGRTWEATLRGLVGLVRLGDVLDVGAGDGVLAELLAPSCGSYTLLERSERLLEAAQKRLGQRPNVSFAHADMHELPFDTESFDQVVAFNVLTYAARPARVLTEAARVLRRGGRLALVTLDAHTHEGIVAAYDHQNLGFAPDALRDLLVGAGLRVFSCAITSRERRSPYLNVVTAFADKA